MKKLFSLLFLSCFALQSFAVPISYTYSGTWSSFTSGDFGATYTAEVIVDNGGTDIANQTFEESDFISVTLSSGSYNNTWLASDISNWLNNFISDASGQLGDGWVDLNNAGGFFHLDNQFVDENASNSSGSAGFFESHVSEVGVIVGAPEPSSFILLGLGLMGLAYTRKKHTV